VRLAFLQTVRHFDIGHIAQKINIAYLHVLHIQSRPFFLAADRSFLFLRKDILKHLDTV
jgi:hypothetical protein